MTGTRTSTAPAVWIAAFMMAGFLSGCLGCGGGNNIRMSLDRPGTLERPVWVGVYFTNSETALDGKEIAELTTKESAKAFGPSDGVVGAPYIQPVYPGKDPILIPLEKYDPAITNILIVANFPKAGACARQKVAVKKGSSLKLRISVDEDCLTVKKD